MEPDCMAGGAETHTIEPAATAPHPFLFHGLDLCTSHQTPREPRAAISLEFFTLLARLSSEMAKCQAPARKMSAVRQIVRKPKSRSFPGFHPQFDAWIGGSRWSSRVWHLAKKLASI